jgi:hypothetical protein
VAATAGVRSTATWNKDGKGVGLWVGDRWEVTENRRHYG